MRLALAIAALLVFLALSTTAIKNAPPDPKAGAGDIKVFFSADKFDAEGYVNNIWDSRIIPYVKDKAVDIPTLQAALKADPVAAGKKYGYRAVAEQNPYNFAVKGKIKLLAVNTKSRNGRAEADVEPFDGKPDIVLQIGPIYKGTSIRDLLDFVAFDDFKNQVEFAKLANQLNFQVRDHVIAPAKILEEGEGKVFEMYGATTQEGTGANLTVVPMILVPATE